MDLDGPWAPHRGLRATLRAAASAPMVWQLEEPRGIPQAAGPDKIPFQQAFEQRVSEAPPAFALWDHPFESDSQSPDLTRKYSAFSRAAEDTLLGRGEQAEESRCKGRGLPLVFRWASQQKPNRQGSIYPERSPCFWGALGQRLLEYRRHRRGIQAATPEETKDTENWLTQKCLLGAGGTMGGGQGLTDLMGKLSKGVAQATLEQLRVGTDLAKWGRPGSP